MVSVVLDIEECLSNIVVGFEYAPYFLAKPKEKIIYDFVIPLQSNQ